MEQARSEHSRLERMRAEMTRQEAQWKEAYDVILAENTALKSSGSEALLASQWRQRYEACLKEKEEFESKLKMETQKAAHADAGKYEVKYRDLKESFRLYRKKAKEMFEAQQNGVSFFCFSCHAVGEKVYLHVSTHIPMTSGRLDEILRQVKRGFQDVLPKKFDGQLLDIRSCRSRSHGRSNWHSFTIYSYGYRSNREEKVRRLGSVLVRI